METNSTLSLMQQVLRSRAGLESESGVRDGYAFAKVWLRNEPETFAAVWTPGDRWFSLSVEGGFSHDEFDEGSSDVEVESTVRRLFEAAFAYLDGDYNLVRSRLLRLPRIVVSTRQGPIELSLSLSQLFRRILHRDHVASN